MPPRAAAGDGTAVAVTRAVQPVQPGPVFTEEIAMATEDRGFASMDPEKQREIARKGGRAAHEKGTAHEWTTDEARTAGRKGGITSHRRRRERRAEPGGPSSPAM
jgi:general stress protein YciG